MLHYVDQLVANRICLLFNAEQVFGALSLKTAAWCCESEQKQ